MYCLLEPNLFATVVGYFQTIVRIEEKSAIKQLFGFQASWKNWGNRRVVYGGIYRVDKYAASAGFLYSRKQFHDIVSMENW